MRRRRDPFQIVGLVTMVIGLALLASFGAGMWHGYEQQQHLNSVWRQQVARPAAPGMSSSGPAGVDPALKRPVDGIDFAIRVPRLGYFAAVREGVDQTILYSGPGHYPETPWPGDPGMVGVAAHNVYWINFPELQPGDEVDLETRYGNFAYRVTGSRIVNPDDRTVLIPNAPGKHLTLTTCWPLWAGAFATKRYVIFTDQFRPGPAPDTTSPTS
jgi:sortase A